MTEWILPAEVLKWSPSRADGMSEEEERTARRKTTIFIDTAGKYLKNLPRVGIATAQVYFHRFYALQSFRKYKRFDMAVTCLFLACKVEEYPRKLDQVICTCHQVWNRLPEPALRPDSPEYEEMRQRILKCERVLLHTIAFDLCVKHPFDDIVETVKRLHRNHLIPKEEQRPLAKQAVSFLNDSMRTNLCLQYDLRKVATAAIYLATVYLEYDLPANGEKWLAQNAITADELADINEQVMQLYEKTLEDPKMHADPKMAVMHGRFCPTSARPRDAKRARHRHRSSSNGAAAAPAPPSSHRRPHHPPPAAMATAGGAPPPPPPPPATGAAATSLPAKRSGPSPMEPLNPPEDARSKRHRTD